MVGSRASLLAAAALLLAAAASGASLPGQEPLHVPKGPATPNLLELIGAQDLAAGAATVIQGLPQESAAPVSSGGWSVRAGDALEGLVRSPHAAPDPAGPRVR